MFRCEIRYPDLVRTTTMVKGPRPASASTTRFPKCQTAVTTAVSSKSEITTSSSHNSFAHKAQGRVVRQHGFVALLHTFGVGREIRQRRIVENTSPTWSRSYRRQSASQDSRAC